jgi:Tfp pilus assembly protein PilE
MQVFCLATAEERADVCCSICGQKYALYFERKSMEERMTAMQMVQETLERHHMLGGGKDVHPQKAFTVPEWHGAAHMSGAAILGGAPPWAA